jgi:elongation factor Ts
MSINAKDVLKLRELTGAGVMEAKKALVETDGDFDKAKEILRKNYEAKASKKVDRETKEGRIGTYVHNGKLGVMVGLACETDFVAKNEAFQELAKNLALHIATLVSNDDLTLEEILSSSYIKDPSLTVEQLIKEHIGKLGENIKITSFVKISL